MIKTVGLFRFHSVHPICSDDNIYAPPQLMWRNFHLVHNTKGWYKRHWETLIYFKHSKLGIQEKTTFEKLVEEDVLPLGSLAGHWQEGLLRLRESKQTITAPKRRHYESSPTLSRREPPLQLQNFLRLGPGFGPASSFAGSPFGRQAARLAAARDRMKRLEGWLSGRKATHCFECFLLRFWNICRYRVFATDW